MEPGFEENAAAFEHTVRATIALAEEFSDADWDLPTDCPGWTVKDIVSHLVSVEKMALGDPPPDHRLPDELPHVHNDLGRMVELGVDVRRPLPGPQVLDELKTVLERRLTALKDIDPDQQTWIPDGSTGTQTRFLLFRAFDCWIHEQDIRRATGRPGGLDAPAARQTWLIMSSGLPYVVAKRAGAGAGRSAVFDITGAQEHSFCVLVSDKGRGAQGEAPAEPTVRIGLDWEDYTRLAAGRCGPDGITPAIEGDAALARRILENMAVTP